MEAAVSPFPNEETTPPVTNIYFIDMGTLYPNPFFLPRSVWIGENCRRQMEESDLCSQYSYQIKFTSKTRSQPG